MNLRNVLITGGAGFVGANLARMFTRRFPEMRVTALDNLKRRGSELNVPALARDGVRFVHGDVRCVDDLRAAGDVDLLVDCAAEPSVSAGLDGATAYVLDTNLVGTLRCLELARERGAALLLLSTSRVYPIAALNALPVLETDARLSWDATRPSVGFSARGIGEEFPLAGPRSLYGASKLAAELILGEFVHAYGLRALVNRCGVLAGPGQWSRVDQGVVTHWMACHHYRRPLAYIGWGGQGKQLRDILHVEDLFDLLVRQVAVVGSWSGGVYNVGGGPERTVSLAELTKTCEALTGNHLAIASQPATPTMDVRVFVTDTRCVEREFGWRPEASVERILRDVHTWIAANGDSLRAVLA